MDVCGCAIRRRADCRRQPTLPEGASPPSSALQVAPRCAANVAPPCASSGATPRAANLVARTVTRVYFASLVEAFRDPDTQTAVVVVIVAVVCHGFFHSSRLHNALWRIPCIGFGLGCDLQTGECEHAAGHRSSPFSSTVFTSACRGPDARGAPCIRHTCQVHCMEIHSR